MNSASVKEITDLVMLKVHHMGARGEIAGIRGEGGLGSRVAELEAKLKQVSKLICLNPDWKVDQFPIINQASDLFIEIQGITIDIKTNVHLIKESM